ncbi:unnamed protein product [Rotaria sordida]|uniref:Formate/nitrite transporter n=1 Tax=Rotaria sordida TaxID=392033 RepID=A0A819RK40_9BILA|nr:unnamed protein product [Rotaria sordida]CAF3779755.1 unnamed protein product [Rotaria sordida]CAF4048433.1 unnamed protein product [Rotaria sordida]
MCDARNVYDTIELISAIGVQKSKQRIDHTIIKSFLAGVLLSFSGLFLIIVGGGSAPLAQSLGPGIQRMIQAAVFPIGLILIVMTGADLFTGNTMTLMISTLHKKTTWFDLIISWVVSYFGNLAGCLFYHSILVYYAGVISDDPYRSFAVQIATVKGNIPWHQMFLRGIGGNWLVCLAILLGITGRDLHSKIIVQVGMMLGANLSVGKYISCVMIPVTLGNIIGGAFFVGIAYWYLYILKNVDAGVKDDVSQVVQNQNKLNQSEQFVSITLGF